MNDTQFELIAEKVVALSVDSKISAMWRCMQRLSKMRLSAAHAVLFFSIYTRVRLASGIPLIDLAELAREAGISYAALTTYLGDLEDVELVTIDGEKGDRTVRATIPALLADRATTSKRRPLVVAKHKSRVLH